MESVFSYVKFICVSSDPSGGLLFSDWSVL